MDNITITINFEFDQPIDDVEAGDFLNTLIGILERECTDGELDVGVLDFNANLAEAEL